MKPHSLIIASMALAGTLSAAAQAVEPDHVGRRTFKGVSIGVGLEYEEGDYGTGDDTEVWRFPLSASLQTDSWLFIATMPFLFVDSAGTVVVRSGRRHGTPLVTATDRSESGLGDVTLSATRYLPPAPARDVEPFLRGRIKLGTADEDEGLGTGETDFAFEAGLNHWGEDRRYFGAIGYEIVGDPPEIDFDNALYGYGGAAFNTGTGQSIGASLNYAQASSPGFDDALELTGFLNQKLHGGRWLYTYILLGLSDGSPDWGFGMNLRYDM